MSNLTTDFLYHWPLILILHDCYDPESASAVLNGMVGVSDEDCAVTIKLRAMDAVRELTNN
jgi:hypothetical protein